MTGRSKNSTDAVSALTALASAIAALRRRDLDGALRHARLAADLAPDDPTAFLVLGRILARTGRRQPALDILSKAAALAADDFKVQYRAGRFCLTLRAATAIGPFERALAVSPDNGPALIGLATALTATRKFAAALRAARRAYEVMPGSAKAAGQLGIALVNLGENDKAIGVLLQATDRLSNWVEALLQLGRALVVLERYQAALPHLRRAVALDPRNLNAHSALIRALVAARRLEEAYRSIDAGISQGLDGDSAAELRADCDAARRVQDTSLLPVSVAFAPRTIDVVPASSVGAAALEHARVVWALGFENLPGVRQLQLQRALADRLGVGDPYFRTLEGIARDTCVIAGRETINFSTYDYLGLNGHPAVAAAAAAAIERYGTSASASRVVAGERRVQRELERALAALHGVEDAVVFVSGHATNVTVIGHLFGPRDLIVHDALVHNSVLEGARLARAQRHVWPHNDWRALDRFLGEQRRRFERVLIAVEGLYSMDGDRPPLDRLIDIKRCHKALLMVDEAHAMGVLGHAGRGSVEFHGIAGDDVDLWMGTLSKSFAGAGGYIAGAASLCEYLKYTAPGFVYSVGIAPPLAAASLAAIEVMHAEPERVRTLADIGRFFLLEARTRGLDTGRSMGHAITPIVVGSSVAAGLLSQALLARGINVLPIVHPAVPERTARLRFFLTCMHVEAQVTQALDALAEEMARLRSRRDLPAVLLAPSPSDD